MYEYRPYVYSRTGQEGRKEGRKEGREGTKEEERTKSPGVSPVAALNNLPIPGVLRPHVAGWWYSFCSTVEYVCTYCILYMVAPSITLDTVGRPGRGSPATGSFFLRRPLYRVELE